VLRLTIGLDLGDRASCYCVLDEKGEVLGRGVVVTERKELEALFGKLPASEVALEVDALAVGESTIGNARTQSDRGQCAAGEADQ
jgi:predicted NBD/HSP70 family sugar kinase